jgi:hypothetical protein
MGVMQALPQKEGVATLWVLSSGAIVACDATFTGERGLLHTYLDVTLRQGASPDQVHMDKVDDLQFTCPCCIADWLGFKQGDLHMRSFVDLVVEREEIERCGRLVDDLHDAHQVLLMLDNCLRRAYTSAGCVSMVVLALCAAV